MNTINGVNFNNNSKVNFGAKLDIEGLKPNRWKNIADIFEKATKKDPEPIIYVSKENGKLVFQTALNSDCDTVCWTTLPKQVTEKFLKLSDTNIAKELTKILKIGKKDIKLTDAIGDSLDNFYRKFNVDEVDRKFPETDETEQTLYDAMAEIKDKAIQLYRDKVLKDDTILSDAKFE